MLQCGLSHVIMVVSLTHDGVLVIGLSQCKVIMVVSLTHDGVLVIGLSRC